MPLHRQPSADQSLIYPIIPDNDEDIYRQTIRVSYGGFVRQAFSNIYRIDIEGFSEDFKCAGLLAVGEICYYSCRVKALVGRRREVGDIEAPWEQQVIHLPADTACGCAILDGETSAFF